MSGWKIALVVAAVIGGLVMCVCAGFGVLAYKIAQGPSNIEVRLDCPARVKMGEDFDITVYVKNTASESQTISNIDVYESYLQGIVINDIEPPASNESSFFSMRTYTLDKKILPGDEVAVKLNATATQPGNYAGDLDVCINDEFTFLTRVLHTVVEP